MFTPSLAGFSNPFIVYSFVYSARYQLILLPIVFESYFSRLHQKKRSGSRKALAILFVVVVDMTLGPNGGERRTARSRVIPLNSALAHFVLFHFFFSPDSVTARAIHQKNNEMSHFPFSSLSFTCRYYSGMMRTVGGTWEFRNCSDNRRPTAALVVLTAFGQVIDVQVLRHPARSIHPVDGRLSIESPA